MSLLTQFYPGPGSSGGSSFGVGVNGAVNVIVTGISTVPSLDTTVTIGVGFFAPPSTDPQRVGDLGFTTTGVYEYVTYNNVNFGGVRLPAATKSVVINNSAGFGPFQSVGDMPNFTGIYGSGAIRANFSLNTNNYPVFTTISTDISIFTGASGIVNITNAALDAATVNHILESIYNSGGVGVGGTRTIDLSGGTSAGNGALTAAGLAAKNALVAAGWTVTLN
jgi:hypothetical protein